MISLKIEDKHKFYYENTLRSLWQGVFAVSLRKYKLRKFYNYNIYRIHSFCYYQLVIIGLSDEGRIIFSFHPTDQVMIRSKIGELNSWVCRGEGGTSMIKLKSIFAKYFGITVTNGKEEDRCPSCRGTGRIFVFVPHIFVVQPICPDCKGNGEKKK